MERYAVIKDKNPREILLLRGRGCLWKQCAFCDYHLDSSTNSEENWETNRPALEKVTGEFGKLEVLNSGSFQELDERTQAEVFRVCREKHIGHVITEVHWSHHRTVEALRRRFAEAGIELTIKLGLETFDYDFRERVMRKGIPVRDIARLRAFADEICLLFGLTGQTVESMRRDVELGLENFERICINLMVDNSTPVKPDRAVIEAFLREIYPEVRDNPRVDVLLNNQDFGIG